MPEPDSEPEPEPAPRADVLPEPEPESPAEPEPVVTPEPELAAPEPEPEPARLPRRARSAPTRPVRPALRAPLVVLGVDPGRFERGVEVGEVLHLDHATVADSDDRRIALDAELPS